MITRTVVISNKLGLHARAAAKLVATASQFESSLRIQKGDKSVDGKSIMSVMLLAASIGTELVIQTDGPDEEAAADAICRLIDDKFGEGE